MATIVVPPVPSTPADPSMTELRAMIGSPTAPVPAPEPKPAASEPAVPAAEEHIETATETVEKQPKPETSEEEPLPEGVQKRIAKEAEKAARIQSEIDRAVSTRKAKEAELQKLQTEGKGSEPVNTPQPTASERPKRPALGEPGHETETWDQFQARESKYDADLTEFVKAEAVREIEQKTAARAAQKSAQERWDAAVAEHGQDFPALMESARELAPEGLQTAISSLEHWSKVAVHLAKDPAKLKQLAATFIENPNRAIATLGRIEAALTSETKPAATTTEVLPEPLKKVGGTASASGEDFQTTVEKGSMSQLRAIVEKARAGKK